MSEKPAYIEPKQEVLLEANETEVQMAKDLRALIDRKEELTDDLKKVNVDLEALSGKLAERMLAKHIDGLKIKGVGTVTVKEINRPSVTEANRERFIAWLDANEMGHLAPRTVHPKRLESLVREQLEEAQALPDGVTNYVQKRASIRRS